jgi:hypothetical protein
MMSVGKCRDRIRLWQVQVGTRGLAEGLRGAIKNARILWAVLTCDAQFNANHAHALPIRDRGVHRRDDRSPTGLCPSDLDHAPIRRRIQVTVAAVPAQANAVLVIALHRGRHCLRQPGRPLPRVAN